MEPLNAFRAQCINMQHKAWLHPGNLTTIRNKNKTNITVSTVVFLTKNLKHRKLIFYTFISKNYVILSSNIIINKNLVKMLKI